MKKVRNIAVIVLSVICVGILVFLLWNLRSTEESAQEIIPEVQPEPMSEQSVSDSDVSGNSAENSADPTELPETEESEPVETEDPVEQRAEELLAGMTLEEKVGQMFIARCPETDAASKVTQYHLGGYILFARDFTGKTKEEAYAYYENMNQLVAYVYTFLPSDLGSGYIMESATDNCIYTQENASIYYMTTGCMESLKTGGRCLDLLDSYP